MTFPPDIIEKVARAIGASKVEPKPVNWTLVSDWLDQRDLERAAHAALETLTALNWPPPSAAVKEEREACAKELDAMAAEIAKRYEAVTHSEMLRASLGAQCDVLVRAARTIRSRSALATGKGK